MKIETHINKYLKGESVNEMKLGSKESLSFSKQVDQNKIAKDGKGVKMTSELYDLIDNKFFTTGNITSKQVSMEKGEVAIHTKKNSLMIKPFGEYLLVRKEDDRNHVETVYYKINK